MDRRHEGRLKHPTQEEEHGSDSLSLASGFSYYRDIPTRQFRVKSAGRQNQQQRDIKSREMSQRMLAPRKKKVEIKPRSSSTKNKNIIVAGIDFGTTYSGIAFSTKHEYETNATTIHTNAWTDGTVSERVPTCLLLNRDNDKTLRSFGRAAKEEYKNLLMDKQADNCYYFSEFKMTLHSQEDIKQNQKLTAANGKKVNALLVFSRALEYLRTNLLDKLKAAITGLVEKDICWVITVPAIWKESAKKFMRLAAEKAGIPRDNIELALEPEAASIYCRLLPVTKTPERPDGVTKFPVGTRYMILDCGGGTVDITIHEIVGENSLVELHKATGGHWGGTQVNVKFLEYLQKLIGQNNYKKFKEVYFDDFLDFTDEFEVKKRSAMYKGGILMRLPTCLRGMLLSLQLETAKVEITGDKLKIKQPVFESFFEESVRSIVAHIHDLLESLPNIGIKAILMVGGYSDSNILQKDVKQHFEKPGTLDVIVPTDASLCVLKGAVIYGHNPTVITERKARYTYGVAMVVPFDVSEHDEKRKFEGDDGEILCNDLFDIHVRVGDTLKRGETQSERSYNAMSASDKCYPIVLFRSSNTEPQYVDEPGCVCEGYFLAKRDASMSTSDEIQVRLLFGLSDIKVVIVKGDGTVQSTEFKLNE